MKQLIRSLLMLLVALMLPALAFCQEVAQAAVQLTGFDPSSYFVSLSALVSAVLFITQWLKKYITTKGVLTKLLSWFVSVALAFGGWYLKLGIFAGTDWYWIFLYALSAGLVSNSVVDLKLIQGFLELFKPKSNA